MERYVVTTRTGQAVVRTDSYRAAVRYQHVLRGRVIDRQAPVVAELEAA